jgi:hypothetical protein
MAIDRMLEAINGMVGASEDLGDVGVEIVDPYSMESEEDILVIEDDDGGMTIDFGGAQALTSLGEISFDANLSEHMEEDDLMHCASKLVAMYEDDKSSRKEWEESYKEGLDLLGLEMEDRTTPWPGACGVFHPLLSESVVRFQAQTIQEIFPARGPVKARIWGVTTPDTIAQAERVKEYMNYQLLEVMTEYRAETEKLLFSLPLSGAAFRKIYYDPTMDRPCSMFVPAEDFVISYDESSLDSAERYTHVMTRSSNHIRKLQVSGFYRDVDLGDPEHSVDVIKDKYDEISGVSFSGQEDDRHQLLEMHVDYDLPGFESPDGIALPYVITIDKSTNKILSIYRNWDEDDPMRKKIHHFVDYGYVPGIGFYNLGLIHMIGGLAKSATSLLRQLVDAGTLSNLPGGLKTRGLRIKGDDTPIMPGEFRDVDVPGGVIRDNITFLPYKEPSGVLYQLLGNIVEEGRRFASMADVKIDDMRQDAPVGTTLAILERAMKVQSAIQARIHASLKKEFKILARIIKNYTSPAYPYETEEGEDIKIEDFNDRVDIIPVSDPNASTLSQRIMQYQAALQLAAQSPDLYDMPLLHRQMMELIGIPNADKIVPNPEDIKPEDPVSENQNMLTLKPIKAFEYQDHAAHIRVHMVLRNDPQIAEDAQNSPMGGAIMAAIDAHIREHLGFQFRDQIEQELGIPLPPMGDPLPADVEKRLSVLVADAADQLLGKKQQQAQAEQQAQQQQDPIIQQRERELAIKEQDVQRKAQADAAKMGLEQQKLAAKQQKDATDAQLAMEKIQTDKMVDMAELSLEQAELEAKTGIEQEKMEAEGYKYAMDQLKGE